MPVPRSTPEIERRLLRDVACDAIRAAILDGSLEPGELIDDKQLQSWLGVSRTPIRDALIVLQGEGLIEMHAQSSTRVASVQIEDVENGLQAIGGVLGAVIRVALPTSSASQRMNLLVSTDTILDAVKRRDAPSHMHAALGLYDVLIDMCPNPVLVSIAKRSIIPLTFQYRAMYATRTPNWDLLTAVWGKFRHGIDSGDNILAELAFEEIHRLPLPNLDWDSAVYNDPFPT